LIDTESIIRLGERIAAEFSPERIILFGSYAYGNPTEDSDIDLLVILPFDGLGMRKAAEILRKINPRMPLDLIVQTPQQVHQRLIWNDFFLREIMEKGKVLYESDHSRVA
jgi:uncharacterized protein